MAPTEEKIVTFEYTIYPKPGMSPEEFKAWFKEHVRPIVIALGETTNHPRATLYPIVKYKTNLGWDISRDSLFAADVVSFPNLETYERIRRTKLWKSLMTFSPDFGTVSVKRFDGYDSKTIYMKNNP